MDTRPELKNVAICCLVVIAASSFITACGSLFSHHGAEQYEFAIHFRSDSDEPELMRALGSQGWYIAAARRASSSDGQMGYELILQRRK